MRFKTLSEVFEDEKRWTRETPARDAMGIPTSSLDDGACCFCLIGAAWNLDQDLCGPRHAAVTRAMRELKLWTSTPSKFNDDDRTTIDDIRRVAARADEIYAASKT